MAPSPTLSPEAEPEVPLEGRPPARRDPRPGLNGSLLLGLLIAASALVSAIAITRLSGRYFFQPAGILVVAGGGVGVMLITTPCSTLLLALRRCMQLTVVSPGPDREELVAEILTHAHAIRLRGEPAIEHAIENVSHPFLSDALNLALDVSSRQELQTALEGRIRASERESETAARVFDLAGGLTPTLGVLGTVIGLIDVLRQLSSANAVAFGVGAAFTSTFYGLALANILLLPVASRIRAAAAETFELEGLMMEGALCLFDGLHPRQIRQRLNLSGKAHRTPQAEPEDELEAAAG